jgi:protein TonB
MDMSMFCRRRDYRAMPLHLRNLLQPIATNSLTGMDLRALLFSSDGGSTATLCHVLDELGVQAEICPELLVAVGRLSTERYDAIIVDWTQETEAALLLKTAREKKALALNVALVPDEGSVGRALQQGANSVIKKPVDAAAARDTLSTARDLIFSRLSEQRDKQARAAVALAELQAQAESIPEMPVVDEATRKTGFLAQNMASSALDAEQNMVKPEYESVPSSFQVARGPSAVQEEKSEPASPPEPVDKKRWDEVRAVFRETPEESKPEPVRAAAPASQESQDATGVFSTFSEESAPQEEPEAEPESSSPPRYLVFAVIACLLVAAILYVWAPGHSYLGRVMSAFHAFGAKSTTNPSAVTNPATSPLPPEASVEKPSAGTESPAPGEAPPSEPPPVVNGEIDPSKIQIIETKVIPKPGAEQPPKDPPSQPDATQSTPADATPTSTPTTSPESQPVVQAPPPPVRPQPLTPAPQTAHAPGEGRTGVIIPDSLKNSPAASPASSLEPSSVPEETSLGLLIHRVEPEYPQQAVAQHLEGPVVLQAWVARDGTVRDLKLVRGYFVLGRAAFDAVKQWRFKPYTPNGKAIDFQTVLTLNFKYPN